MPFASFRMNQSTRLANDLSTLGHWSVSTTEDKVIAAKSLAGFSAEMATFKILSGGITLLLGSAAKMLMGKDEDEEEYEKRKNNVIKAQITGSVTDVFSPNPLLDKPIQEIAYYSLDKVQDLLDVPAESKFNIYDVKKQDFIKSLGLFGIVADRATQLTDLVYLSQTGKFKDDYGKEKWISARDQTALTTLIGPAFLANMGLAPSEVSGIIRMAISDAKKGSSTTEGGKTEDKQSEESTDKIKTKNKKEKEAIQDASDLDILNQMKADEYDTEKKRAIEEKINRIANETTEEKKARKEEKEMLLEGYDNQSDMKRYDREKWDKNFGPDSDWGKQHKLEIQIDNQLDKERQKVEDEMRNYTPKGGLFGTPSKKFKKNQGLFGGSSKGGGLFGTSSSKTKEQGSGEYETTGRRSWSSKKTNR